MLVSSTSMNAPSATTTAIAHGLPRGRHAAGAGEGAVSTRVTSERSGILPAAHFKVRADTRREVGVTLALIAGMTASTTQRPPLPPFDRESAINKVRIAEDGWNTRDPHKVSLAYSLDSQWRNRAEFVTGREAIVQFLGRKWTRELDYRLIKELWCFDERRIAVR